MKKCLFGAFIATLLSGTALAQDPLPSDEALHDVYPKQDNYLP